ncbi:MAG: ribokinase [Clostridia bacterium]|nr:ribokinase [Clostridia bacterium]
MRILNYGSLNIDETYAVPHFVQAGETLAPTAFARNTGGKGLNQSVALSRAGAKVYHAGCIGADGEFLTDFLTAAGVDCRFVRRVDTPTGRAIIQVVPAGQNCILLYGGANQAQREGDMRETLSHFDAGDVLLLQNEINGIDFLVREAHARGMRVALNPSPFDEGLLALPTEAIDYLILNEVEAAAMSGKEEPAAALRALRARYPHANVLLTLGSQGSLYSGREGDFAQQAYRVRAVDTTGAGDTFTGYFLASVSAGMPVPQAMELSARAAAVAVTRNGAAVAIPTPAEIAAFQF